MSRVRWSGLLLLWAPMALAAQADSLRRGVELPIIVITGVPLPTMAATLGFSVTTLRLDALRHGPAADAAGTLAALAGAATVEGAGVNGPTNVSLRGADEQYTQVLSDGLPLNISGGFLDVGGLTLVNVERVEIARGPQSVMHGSAAMAGAVQFVSRRGRPGPLRASLAAEGGSGIDRGTQSRIEILADGGTDAVQVSAGVGMAYDRGIYRLPHDLWTREGAARVDARLHRAVALTATARYADMDVHLPVRDPGVTRAPLDPNQRNARDRLLLGVVSRVTASPSWEHALTVGAMWDDATYTDEFDDVAATTTYPYFVADFDLTVRSVLRRLITAYDSHVRTGRFLWAYGVRLEREDVDNELGGQFGDATEAFTRSQRSAYAEVAAEAGRLHARVGGRVEGTDDLGTAITPRVAIAVRVADGLQVRAAAGRAFKVPNIQQQYFTSPNHLPNPDLRPETSWTIEGGLEVAPASTTTIGVTAYHQWYEGLMRTVPVDSVTRTNRNIGASRAWGLEVSARTHLTGTITATVAAARMVTRMDDNTGLAPTLFPVGAPLPGPPHATARVALDGRTSGLHWGLGMRAVGERLVLSERFDGTRETLSPHVLLDLRVAVPVGESVMVYGRAENFLDTSYDVAFDRPGRPATLVLGIQAGR